MGLACQKSVSTAQKLHTKKKFTKSNNSLEDITKEDYVISSFPPINSNNTQFPLQLYTNIKK